MYKKTWTGFCYELGVILIDESKQIYSPEMKQKKIKVEEKNEQRKMAEIGIKMFT